MSAQHTPRVSDNDRDEITITLDGKQVRGWSYASENERRTKMLAAREFAEGWHFGAEHCGAPEMLAALKAYADAAFEVGHAHGRNPVDPDGELLGLIRAAIAKAEAL